MAQAAIVHRIFRVGKYTCEMTIAQPERGKVGFSTCEWSPDVPVFRELTPAEQRQYLEGRYAALAELQRRTGLRIATLDGL